MKAGRVKKTLGGKIKCLSCTFLPSEIMIQERLKRCHVTVDIFITMNPVNRLSVQLSSARAIGAGGRGSIPGRTQCRQRLATAATFLRSYAAQALSRGDGSRH